MDVVGIIPARYASTRLPYKLTRNLLTKPLLQWTWENASKASILDKLIIACDDPKIEIVAREFGAETVLTSPQHISGTDRVTEAMTYIDARIVINIQADEPLIHPSVINSLGQVMLDNSDLVMATVRKKLGENDEVHNPNMVKVTCDKDGFALYFSRFPIPYYRDKTENRNYYKHVGIYAYTKDFLYIIKNLPFSSLEEAERLEQLRVLEAGYKIKVVETEFDCQGVDTEEDLQKVKEILQNKGRSNGYAVRDR